MSKKYFRYYLTSLLFVLVMCHARLRALSVTAVGDVFISSRMLSQHEDHLATLTLQGDIIFANLEGVLIKKPAERDRLALRLGMPYEAMGILKKTGFSALSFSNNHIFDYGQQGYRETCQQLAFNGFFVIPYNSPGLVVKKHGRSVRIIAFTFSGTNNVNNTASAKQIIAGCHEDIIIISAHMGGERGECTLGVTEYFGEEARGDLQKFSRACIDAGADLVIGHGSHQLRSVELYRERFIAYSLGNFIFDYPGSRHKHHTGVTCAMTVIMDDGGRFQQARLRNYLIQQGVPRHDPTGRAFRRIRILSQQNKSSRKLVFRRSVIYKAQ